MQKFFFSFFTICFAFLNLVSSHANITPLPDYEERLSCLKAQAEKELDLINYPTCSWVQIKERSDGGHIYDVVIIGGGQTGQTLAFALRKEKVTNVIVFDENEKGLEGPWLTYAHMADLQTPKSIIGPDCNVPTLTCRSWFETKYGEEEWIRLKHVPRTVWADYLLWFRDTLKLPVVNNTRVGAFKWNENEGCFSIPLQSGHEYSEVFARKVVVATGLQGSGSWVMPSNVKDHLPKSLYTSVYEHIDFRQLQGKKVAILGGGPSAFDNALMCSEYGVDEIHMFFKRPKLVCLHSNKCGESVGFLKHYSDLCDKDKWNFISKMYEYGQAPTKEGVAKVKALSNVHFHFDCCWFKTEVKDDKAKISTPEGEYIFDHLLVATGWVSDLHKRVELKEFCDMIALWSDRFSPPDDQHSSMLHMPYLGRHFEFTEKNPGEAPYLNSIFNCTGGALLSNGFTAGTGLTGMKYSIPKIVDGIVKQLFLEDIDDYYEALDSYDEVLGERQ